MVMMDNDDRNSMSAESSRRMTAPNNINNNNSNRHLKQKVYNEILWRLKESGNDETKQPGFDDELLAHFSRLLNRFVQLLYCSPEKQISQSIYPPPAFGSLPDLEALALEATEISSCIEKYLDTNYPRPLHEITFSMDDKPKLLNQLTCLLAEVGLNIQEAHAFSTVDHYSLDVFVVN